MDGAAGDKNNVIYAVNYGNNNERGTIGRFYPNGTSELYYSDSASVFTGMRFDFGGNMYVGDVANKRVLRITPDKNVTTFCSDPNFLDGVPNDLALASNGNIFLSGQNFATDSGEVWLCTPAGNASRLAANLGRTNGIELSPNDKILYVSEARSFNGAPVDNVIRAFDVDTAGQVSNSRVFFNFTARVPLGGTFDTDGIKVDIDGTLFITRSAGGVMALIAATGGPLFNIGLSFLNPTNVEFGGSLGSTVFIVGRCSNSSTGCVDTYVTAKAGRGWTLVRGGVTPPPARTTVVSPNPSIPIPPNAASPLIVNIVLAAVALLTFVL
jgi:sugar lactone lactonase YvrE